MGDRLNSINYALLMALLALTTLAYGTVHQPTIAAFYLIVALMVVLFAGEGLARRTLTVSLSGLQFPIIALGCYGLLQAAAISIDPFSTWTSSVHILFLAAVFTLALSYINGEDRLRRTAGFVTVFGFAYAFYAILQMVLSPGTIYGIYTPTSGAPVGSFVNKHDFAAAIELLIGVPLGLLFSGALDKDKRLLYLVAVVIMGTSILASGSRGGLVALLAEVLFAAIITSRSRGRRNTSMKLGLSALLFAGIVAGSVFVGRDTSLTRLAIGQDDVTSSRSQIWSVTIKVIGNYLPWGTGLGAFAQAYTRFDPSGGPLRVEQAHNDYLQVLSDAGLVGLLLGCWFLYLFLRQGVRTTKVVDPIPRAIGLGAFAGCFAVLVHSFFDFVLHITAISVSFLTLLALVVAATRRSGGDNQQRVVALRS